MTRYRFYIGTDQVTDEGTHFSVSDSQWERVENLLTHYFSGFTRYLGQGAWTDGQGQLVKEWSKVYEVLESPGERAHGPYTLSEFGRMVALKLRDAAHQESVLFTAETVVGEFV